MKNSPKLQKWFVFFLGIAITVLWFIGSDTLAGVSGGMQICGFIVLLSTSSTVFYIFFHQKENDDFAHSNYQRGLSEGYTKAMEDQDAIRRMIDNIKMEQEKEYREILRLLKIRAQNDVERECVREGKESEFDIDEI